MNPRSSTSHLPYKSAYRRIGVAPVRNLRWLLTFAERDCTGLTPQDEEALRDEVLAFTLLGYVKQVSWLPKMTTPFQVVKTLLTKEVSFTTEELECAFPLQIIISLQQMTRDAIEQYRIHGGITLPPVTLWRRVQREPKGGTVFTFPLPSPQFHTKEMVSFTEQLAEVLTQEGWRLRACEDERCKRVFIENRYGQQYCTNRCRSRIAMQRKREADKSIQRAQGEARRSKRAKTKPNRTKTLLTGGSHHGKKKR